MRHFLVTILLPWIILATGCQGAGPISKVKQGILDVDKSLTVGEAFGNYKYLSDMKWSALETENGRTVVEVSGVYDYDNLTLSELARSLDMTPEEFMQRSSGNARRFPGGPLGSFQGFLDSASVSFSFLLNKDGTVQIREMQIRQNARGEEVEGELKDRERILSELKLIYDNRVSGFAWIHTGGGIYDRTG